MRALAPLALLLLFAAGCATAGGARAGGGPAPPGEAVSLQFGWPRGFEARVTLVHREQRLGGSPASARASHRLVTEQRGSLTRVLVRDVEAEGDVPDLEENVRISEALVQVISRDGTYARTDGLDEALEILSVRDAQAREVARAALDRIARLDWEVTAGAWAGRSLEAGRPLRRQFSGSIPLLPAAPALLDVAQAFLGRVSCEEGGVADCVALSWRGVPLEADRAAALKHLREENGEGDHTVDVEEVGGEVEARLVAEPSTLVPHRLDVTEELRLKVRQPGGDAIVLVERSEDHYEFLAEQEL